MHTIPSCDYLIFSWSHWGRIKYVDIDIIIKLDVHYGNCLHEVNDLRAWRLGLRQPHDNYIYCIL